MNLQRYKILVSSHYHLCQILRPQVNKNSLTCMVKKPPNRGDMCGGQTVILSLVRSLEKRFPKIQIYTDLDNMHAQEQPSATIPLEYM